jgi:hypothetical protein
MWIQMFTVVLAVALASAVGAIALESKAEAKSSNMPVRD